MANELNVFGNAPQGITAQSVTAAMATTRQAQEVQAAMVVAKNFPRDTRQSMNRILEACMRPTLAEAATYEFSRGGSKVYGPSIRLAEAIAQSWGNIDFGFTELDRKERESTVMAYAWDLETNTRQTRVFTVRLQRDTKNGSYALTEERDIYEMIANQASRRVRNCILSLIPGDVIDAALKQCDITLKEQEHGVPIEQRRQDMVAAFEQYNITPEMIAAFCGKKSIEFLDEADLKKMQRTYNSFRDGLVGTDYFVDRMNALATENAEKAQNAQKPPKKSGDAPGGINTQGEKNKSEKPASTFPEYGTATEGLPFEMNAGGLDSL